MENRNEKIFCLFKNGKSYKDLSKLFNFSSERARQIIFHQMERDILRRLNFKFDNLSTEERALLEYAVKEEISEVINKRKNKHAKIELENDVLDIFS